MTSYAIIVWLCASKVCWPIDCMNPWLEEPSHCPCIFMVSRCCFPVDCRNVCGRVAFARVANRTDCNKRSQLLLLKDQCVQVSGAPHELGSPSAADLAGNVSQCHQVGVSCVAAACVATALGKSRSEAGAATILSATAEVDVWQW